MTLHQDYEQRRGSAAPAALTALRARGAADFDRLGLPTPRVERWKYTNLAPVETMALVPGATDPLPAALVAGADRIVLGAKIERSVGALPDGVHLGSIADAPDAARALLGTLASSESEALVALNAALADDALVLFVPAGVAVPRPIELIVPAQTGVASYPRLLVVLEANASATIIERHEGAGAGFVDLTAEIALGAGAKMRHWRVQVAGDARRIVTSAVRAGADSSYRAFTLTLGGRLVRNQCDARVDGDNAEVELDAAYVIGGDSHVDTTTRVVHGALNGTSRQTVKGVLDGHSRGVFQGKVLVEEGAQKTDGYQLSRALLLSRDAEVDVKPELEIYADDVKCSHGATTGRLDEDALFYLRARGIPAQEARALLVEAFVAEAIERVDDETVRAALLALAAGRLARDQQELAA
ncbi:Fe-S cluster assembly protein SufD [Roseiterribacter gracilis]|uniref:Fe-S cluster assembly protein SufD n=1 Tax=Roseiterribacter gracilis TaxID=2812848 RepID=A0A8S8X5Z3_9PROT|nr:Fe-S cluster assembly protein SufD [Rhodospirillales bacterium TMPK1]